MRKKIICYMLLGLLLFPLIVCTSVQAEPVASGTFGRPHLAMEWSVEGNTLYITGNGYMDGFSKSDSRPWDPYRNQIERVVMTGKIDNIAYYAFQGCTKLTEIVWPDGLQYIHEYAFDGCTGLKKVTIPEPVEIIYGYAFHGCTGLKEVTMAESVKNLKESAFSECSALHTVNLSPKLREIARNCFSECKSLKQIQLPDTLELIGDAAFANTGLVKITIPERVRDLPSGMLMSCSALEEVIISCKRLESLGSKLFANCPRLVAPRLPADINAVYMDTFYGCDTIKTICFYGDMPQFYPPYNKFEQIYVTVYYPEGNTTWTQEKIDAFQDEFSRYAWGEVKFQPTVYQQPVEHPTEPTEAPVTEKPTEQTVPATEPTATPTEQTQPTTELGADNATAAPSTAITDEDQIQQNEQGDDGHLLWLIIGLSAVLIVLIGTGCGMVIMLRKRKR